MRVCPDRRCAELNGVDATHCHLCGKALVHGAKPWPRKTISVPEPMHQRQCLGVED